MSQRSTSVLGRDRVRRVNQGAVFTAIHQHGPISRVDLARELRLSAAAVSGITSPLVASGLVFEAEQGVTAGAGRKPILLRVNYDFANVFGVKVSDTAITTAFTNLEAEVVGWRKDELEGHDVETVVETVCRAVEALLAESDLGRDQVAGIGINLPGIVDSSRGLVRRSPLLGWLDVPIAEMLESRLGIPALAENDVNALAAAAAWFGPGKGHGDFLVLTLGRGVGLGIVLNGNVYRGPQGGAGEFGHTLLDASGPASEQAGRGTVEAFLSDAALLARARQRLPAFDSAAPEDLVELALSANSDARGIFDEAGEALGRSLANLVNIFAPSLILLGGEGMRAAELLLPSAEAAMRAHSFGDLAEHVELVVHSWGDEAWAQGAAGLAASRFLNETAPLLGGDQRPDTEVKSW
jgi:predicted NBD/HSP70 family sugar kinase